MRNPWEKLAFVKIGQRFFNFNAILLAEISDGIHDRHLMLIYSASKDNNPRHESREPSHRQRRWLTIGSYHASVLLDQLREHRTLP